MADTRDASATFVECFLLVPDLDVARTFYEGAVGLSVSTADDRSATFDADGTTLKLQADYPDDVFDSFNITRPNPDGRGAGAMLAVDLSEDLAVVHDRVDASAGEALFEPRAVPWLDGPMFLAKDPAGYTLELR